MATFNMTVTEPIPTYDRVTSVVQREDCEPLVEAWTVQLNQENSVGDFDVLKNYSGDPWQELTITGIAENDPLFVLNYNGTPVGSLLPLTISVNGLAEGASIALLTVDTTTTASTVSTAVITVYFTVKTTGGTTGANLSSAFQLQGLACTTITEPTLSAIVPTTPICGDNGDANDFTITGDISTTYKYQIATVDNGTHGYTAKLTNTDTTGTISPSAASYPGGTVDGEYTTKADGTINLNYDICAKPARDENDNCVQVLFILYEADGITLSTTERITFAACSTFG